jgi:DNA primase catalytic core
MNNFTETVRNSADIVRVVSDYVSLKGAGSTLKGLCPFHSEKTPSFTVHRDKQFFHCFGCHAGGDAFSFVMLAEKIPFPEAVELVAEKCGIPIPAAGMDNGKSDERKQLFEIHDRAAAYFPADVVHRGGWHCPAGYRKAEGCNTFRQAVRARLFTWEWVDAPFAPEGPGRQWTFCEERPG